MLKLYEYENFLHRLGFSDMEALEMNIENKWFEDGPLLPIEFTRQSDNGRMTLIIDITQLNQFARMGFNDIPKIFMMLLNH